MSTKFQPGDKFEVRYPFVQDRFISGFDEHGMPESDEGWRPGCSREEIEDGFGYDYAADAHGQMLLEVISTHKPGKFIDRVFFIRRWRDPDGKVFGKTNLRVTTAAAFGRLLKGYRHEYECDEETEETA
ncbi:hypothetical protein [Niveibacterium terrae]|uniref:hypothetical protein n=1 Tax=Niveibacterium terrae TaxID=3373598 RepID=UPI003A8EB2DA